MPSPSEPALDPEAVVQTLDRHGVEYLVVGGVATRGYGAKRLTYDMDCLVKREVQNLHRLAAAMKDLGARLRVEGLDDEQAKALPVQLDGYTLANSEITTWRTDAGNFDVLVNIPGADGQRMTYEDLVHRSTVVQGVGFAIRAAALEDIIASKEWANRPKDQEALPELRAIAAGQPEAQPTVGDLVERAHPTSSTAVVPPRTTRHGPGLEGPAPEVGLTGPQAELG